MHQFATGSNPSLVDHVGNLCTTIAIDSLDSFDSVAVVTVAVASTIGKAIATAAMR
jgi:S-adenosylmethionine synthetase